MTFSRTSKTLLTLSAVVAINLGSVIPAYAGDTFSVASLSSESNSCITTLSQEEFNEGVMAKKVVWPMPEGYHSHTSSYGARINPVTGESEIHSGMDMAGPDKTPIHSVASGTVMAAGPTSYLGEWVIVRHNFDGKIYDSVYGHLTSNSQSVKVGDKVEAGQVIALEGSTGMSTGPHLHLEIWEGGFMTKDSKHINPDEWLKAHNVTPLGESPALKPLDCAFGEITRTTNVAWGGHSNGAIPEDKIVELSFNKDHRLETAAAARMEKMNEEFKKEFKKDLPLLRSYESLEEQTKNDATSIVGKSFYGWGKSVEMKFENATNPYIPLVSEPNYFTDPEYVWLSEHGKEFGWLSPSENKEDGESPNPGRWVYSEQAANTNSPDALRTYLTVNAMTHSWHSEAQIQHVSELLTQDGDWDTGYNSNNEFGLGKLSEAEITSYGYQLKDYLGSSNIQIAALLDYISDKYGTPEKALEHWKTHGTY